jgi:hypothetical protein
VITSGIHANTAPTREGEPRGFAGEVPSRAPGAVSAAVSSYLLRPIRCPPERGFDRNQRPQPEQEKRHGNPADDEAPSARRAHDMSGRTLTTAGFEQLFATADGDRPQADPMVVQRPRWPLAGAFESLEPRGAPAARPALAPADLAPLLNFRPPKLAEVRDLRLPSGSARAIA